MANYVIWVMGQSNAWKVSQVYSGAYPEPYGSADLTCKYRGYNESVISDKDFQTTANRVIGVEVGIAYWFNVNRPDDQLYILQYGYPSAAITESPLKPKTWYKGSIYGTDIVYDNFVPQANELISTQLPAEYIDLGVFWLQGESDGTSGDYITAFNYLFDNLFADVQGWDKNIAISSLSLLASGATIDAKFQTIIDSDPTKYTPLVQTSDLVYDVTGVHYDVPSYLILGQRGIEALFDFYTSKLNPSPSTSVIMSGNNINIAMGSKLSNIVLNY